MADWKTALAALGGVAEDSGNDKAPTDIPKRQRVGVVYSTNPDFTYVEEAEDVPTLLPKNQQRLRLCMERAGRGGKTVTLVKGFVGPTEDLAALARTLKQKCGVGGSVDGDVIVIQGDKRPLLLDILKKQGYTQTK